MEQRKAVRNDEYTNLQRAITRYGSDSNDGIYEGLERLCVAITAKNI